MGRPPEGGGSAIISSTLYLESYKLPTLAAFALGVGSSRWTPCPVQRREWGRWLYAYEMESVDNTKVTAFFRVGKTEAQSISHGLIVENHSSTKTG